MQILKYYSAGVNAYLKDHQGSQLSLEYAVLKLINSGYKPEPWTPLNTLAWAKLMAWDLGGNMDSEITRAVLLQTLTPEQLAEIVPPYPEDHPIIVPNPNVGATVPNGGQAGSSVVNRQLVDLLKRIENRAAKLESLTGPSGPSVGSNSWVVSGQLTTTGMSLLVNDPHLDV